LLSDGRRLEGGAAIRRNVDIKRPGPVLIDLVNSHRDLTVGANGRQGTCRLGSSNGRGDVDG
jgi:hypothetical protein